MPLSSSRSSKESSLEDYEKQTFHSMFLRSKVSQPYMCIQEVKYIPVYAIRVTYKISYTGNCSLNHQKSSFFHVLILSLKVLTDFRYEHPHYSKPLRIPKHLTCKLSTFFLKKEFYSVKGFSSYEISKLSPFNN